jgi:TPR repeat protein
MLGLGFDIDETKAFQIYLAASNNGSSLAMYNIGLCYHSGIGVPLNRSFGVDWFEKSAKLGNDKGQFALGKCFYWVFPISTHYQGIGIDRDFEDAVLCFIKSSDSGNPDALYYLGLCHQRGRGVTRSYDSALSYYRRSASHQNGHADSELSIGKLLITGTDSMPQDVGQASTWFEMSANKGNPEAQYQLGSMYYSGASGFPLDYTKAAGYFQDASGVNADAMFMLGMCYEKGLGIGRDVGVARVWYEKAVGAGSEEAVERIGSKGFRVKMRLFK